MLLCSPRGFCAGVVRAIELVERALAIYGAPVYVRHEIVHNRYVVDSLRTKGAIFVEELSEVPDDHAPVIFSAHGVRARDPRRSRAAQSVYDRRDLPAGDQGASRGRDPLPAWARNRADRPCRPSGSCRHHGPIAAGSITLVETLEDIEKFTPRDAHKLAYVTQTTLSVDDTAAMVDLLKQRFPNIVGPHKEDICYATTNRQDAVKRVAPVVDAMIVVGAPNSSNSQRLKEVAEKSGCPRAVLVQRAADINWGYFDGVARLGITAGASAPEVLVEEILGRFRRALRDRHRDRHSDGGGRVLPAAPPAAGARGGGVTLNGGLHRRFGGRSHPLSVRL